VLGVLQYAAPSTAFRNMRGSCLQKFTFTHAVCRVVATRMGLEGVKFSIRARIVHALFEAKMPEKPHGYCVITLRILAF
jgi:hypothetical protein